MLQFYQESMGDTGRKAFRTAWENERKPDLIDRAQLYHFGGKLLDFGCQLLCQLAPAFLRRLLQRPGGQGGEQCPRCASQRRVNAEPYLFSEVGADSALQAHLAFDHYGVFGR